MPARTLLEELLAKPVGPPLTSPAAKPDLTSKVEMSGDRAEVTLNLNHPAAALGIDPDTTATALLEKRGEDAANWEVTNVRAGEWTMATGAVGESVRYSFRRIGMGERPALDELIASIDARKGGNSWPEAGVWEGDHGFIVALGDMQFGKMDGDGVEGSVRRTIDYLDKAALLLEDYRQRFNVEHVHIAWLGDHVEGFVSQGGANTWRTTLTMNEQIRLTRRVMLYALQVFAPLCSRLTMAAVPGNHGEPQRFSGKGLTRYDDSHDTESLIAVKDAVDLWSIDVISPYGHVEFFVPETDEMTVVVDVCGTVVGHAHGHKWRAGKHFEWWKGQSFNRESALGQCDLLLAGHLHHTQVEEDGNRMFIQVPAMESESTWWRHAKGSTGNPGLIVAVTKDGQTGTLEIVR